MAAKSGFPGRLFRLRRIKDRTRFDIDVALGWERGTIRKFEDGSEIPAPADIEDLAMHFGVNIQWLVQGTGIRDLPKISA